MCSNRCSNNVLSDKNLELGLTFDDVLIVPRESSVLPAETNLETFLTTQVQLKIPLISSPMDTVTEHQMAIAMAKNGGIGVIHKNLSIEQQVKEVKAVKNHFRWLIDNPVMLNPGISVDEAAAIMCKHGFSGAPVVDGKRLVGIITNRDMRFISGNTLVADVMSKERLITVKSGIAYDDARAMLLSHRLERLIVVDNDYNCVGLITMRDVQKCKENPTSALDSERRLLVAAAIGVNPDIDHRRAVELHVAGADAIVVDTAHGHSKRVFDIVQWLRKEYPTMQIIAGNVATAEGAEYLIKAGADTIKVGIGPGSICTTRIVAGVGVPQLSAITNVVRSSRKHEHVKIIADGGMRGSGDVAKALAAGADSVMIGSMFAGCKESPGSVVVYKGRAYKSYRGMGSLGAMSSGSADRYGHRQAQTKLVAEGVEGIVPFQGDISDTIAKITGGLRSSMGYTGSATIKDMQEKCEFIRITSAGLYESHPHDVQITHEEPGAYVKDEC